MLYLGEDRFRQKGSRTLTVFLMLVGLIAFCIAFGMMISVMGKRAQIMIDFFFVLNEIIMRLVTLIMWYACFLLQASVLRLGHEDPAECV